jgi:hypothetical protein
MITTAPRFVYKWLYHVYYKPNVEYIGISVSSTNKTDHHGITEILLKVALNTMTLPLNNAYIWEYFITDL